MKKALIAIRLEAADVAAVEEVQEKTGYTQSDSIRLLMRLGYSVFVDKMGTPLSQGVKAKEASKSPLGEEA
jgi:hypothetical protein